MATRRFNALDGLRAISVLLVLMFHALDPVWRPINGYLGVTVFFVISGFIITTLLLREEQRDGSATLTGFYLRRVFRLAPVYVCALVTFSAAIAIGLGSGGHGYAHRLVYFSTFTNELRLSGSSWNFDGDPVALTVRR